MQFKRKFNYITEEDYLKGELESEIKHEYVDGEVYAMAGVKVGHARLTATLTREFGNHLRGKPCDALPSDFKVRVGTKYFYPDIVVKCDSEQDHHEDYTEHPILLAEVTSPSTRQFDKTFKLAVYQTIPSLQEYVIVEQDQALVDVYHRNGETWEVTSYQLGDEIHFKSIDLVLSVLEIYARVDNADVREYLAKQAVTAA